MTGNTQFEETPREGLIKQELITYEVKNGVLRMCLPKSQKEKAQKINVM